MKKKKIGIVGNCLFPKDGEFNNIPVTYTPQGFVTGTQRAGGIPIVMPISTDLSLIPDYIDGIDVLILPGGQDVDPVYFDEEPIPQIGEVNPDRDAFEFALLNEAIKQGKGIFGVCRGMQLINVALGGTLYQDLSTQHLGTLYQHSQEPTAPKFATHHVFISEESKLHTLYNSTKHRVNSFHHQAIRKLATSLDSTATSLDGLIEGFESSDKSQRILGVQWHPELLLDSVPSEQKLFDYVVTTL